MPLKTIERTPSANYCPLLIKNLLRTPVIYSPEQEIVYRDRIRYNYLKMTRRVSRLAGVLERLGVTQGDTVGIMDWDSHRYLECFFAVPMMGAVLHTINIRLSPDQLVYTVNHAEDDVILINPDFLPLLESVKDKLTSLKKIIILSDDGSRPETGLVIDGDYESLLSQSSSEYDFPEFSEDAMATTFYTTGTTGLPKGVYFSHRQIVLHTYGLLSVLCGFRAQASLDSGDVYMPLTPMFHVHAWGLPYLCTMLGMKQVYPGRYEPEMILKLIAGEHVSFSHCVPTIMHMLVTSPGIDNVDLSHWKVLIGGSALSKGLCKSALDHGINLYAAYGMSETCPLLTVANLKPHMLDWEKDRQIEMRCRMGLPAPNVDMKVIDSNGKALPHDGKSVGEIVVRAPWLTQGYLKEPDRSEELWDNGWLHTGDIGYIDPEGYLKITDRVKDVIKTGGEWISSLELEDILTQHEAVSEVAVIGVPDEKWGERPLAIVVLHEKYRNSVQEDDLRGLLKKADDDGVIPKYGVPERIVFAESIPKTSVGKLDKKTLRQGYQ